jgi:hypothetical protein
MSHPSLRMGFVSTRLAGTDGDRGDLKSLRPWWPHYGKRANVLLPNAARTRRKDSHFPFHPPILACRSRNHAVAAAPWKCDCLTRMMAVPDELAISIGSDCTSAG